MSIPDAKNLYYFKLTISQVSTLKIDYEDYEKKNAIFPFFRFSIQLNHGYNN